jgi:hypothetical protein
MSSPCPNCKDLEEELSLVKEEFKEFKGRVKRSHEGM